MPEITKPPVIRIPGTPEVTTRRKETSYIRITESRTYRISAARAVTAQPEEHPYQPDEVVEIEFLDGTRIWTSSRRLVKELLRQREPKRGGDAEFQLATGLDREGAGRGMVGKIIFNTLTFLGVDVAGKTAKLVAEKWEEHTLGVAGGGCGPGLYYCSPGDTFQLKACDPSRGKLVSGLPVLLFLHGTASCTRSSFGELWQPEKAELRQKLFAPYGDNVLALEHRTLSASPVQNAIELAEALHQVLPPGSRLHLVSHSRGGLVGELLSRVMVEGEGDPFTTEELEWFHKRDPEKSRGDLAHLNTLLGERKFGIDRFVRVACPAWGTTLASTRLDIYLSLLFNLLTKAFSAYPGCKIVCDIFTELIMLVAKERTDPSVLPGIEAMIPGTPLVQLLNFPGCKVGGELRVIAGDIERGGVLSTIATLITDPLYQNDNDLVVDTDAMFGGAARTGGAAFSFHRGSEVSHFNYFKNDDSAKRLLKTLTRPPRADDGFEVFSMFEKDRERPPYRRGAAGARPVVFLLPGAMGSHLSVAGERIWLDPERIARGELDKLRLDSPDVKAEEPIWRCYGKLVEYLSASHEVIPFAYDWRHSHKDVAAALARALEEALDAADQEPQAPPVSIIAHSSGGLLARYLIAGHNDIWLRMGKHPQSRLIMLGTPNGGSYAIAQLLTGRDSLIKQLALLDMKHDGCQLLTMFSSYPGLLELLPDELLDHDQWEKYSRADARRSWRVPSAAALQKARDVRQQIYQATLDSSRVSYVAGHAAVTPCAIFIDRDDDGNSCLAFRATAEGDGWTVWKSGVTGEVKNAWYVPCAHGDLPSDEQCFPALAQLLAKGKTDLLDVVAPVTPGSTRDFHLPEQETPIYTRMDSLSGAAMGAKGGRRQTKAIRRVRVSVAHGNLGFANHAILVGHYQGDTIVSAESHLDRIMDGRLRNRHSLDLYPGEDDTAEAFLNPKGKPSGAIIIGLGEVGKLTPGKLMRAVSRGVRAYAVAVAECRASAPEIPAPSGISTLLVGTNAGGVSVEDSVTAILRGVDNALQFMQEQGFGDRVALEELEFVEVYEDRAIHAVHALDRARNDRDISRRFLFDSSLVVNTLEGALRRASFSQEDPWWQRLEITENRAGRLSFNVLTDRARSIVFLQQSQRALADQFIKEIMEGGGNTSDEVAVTLFEMLVPNEIKESAPDREDVVLVLNKESARYPWEMMRERPRNNRGGRHCEPLSVQAGMIRQLQVRQFRDRVVMARGQAALVIGNPLPTKYVSLGGAEEEAREVQKRLSAHGYDTVPLVGKDATAGAIMKVLYAQDYRIVHLAGHGVFELPYSFDATCESCGAEKIVGKITGMVIGEDVFLTPAQLAQMHAVPELVFINCCHLGNPGHSTPPPNNLPHLAANVATELIAMGVKAVVAAGWEVNDQAAQRFAAVFYDSMLAGTPFGRSVQNARIAVYREFPSVNTWGAYQCYGDHAFCLTGTDGKAEATPKKYRFAAPVEVVTRLDNISQQAKTADEEVMAGLAAEAAAIYRDTPEEWRKSGAILAALAAAYAELYDFPKAVECYAEALQDEKSPCAVKALEQFANVQVRLAVEIAETDPVRAEELVEESRKRIVTLNELLGPSVERWSLLGSNAKRKAMVAAAVEDKKEALEEMARQYGAAYDLSGKSSFYPYSNQLTAQVLLALLRGEKADEATRANIDQAAALHSQGAVRNFWDRAASADFKLLQHMASNDLSAHVGDIVTLYQEAAKVSASPRELSSVLEHLAFLHNVVAVAPIDDKEKEALLEIRSKLRPRS